MKTSVVNIKGSTLTVLVLQINDRDHDQVFTAAKERIAKGSALFANAPVVLDLTRLDAEQQNDFNLVQLVARFRELGVVPVAVRGAASGLEEQVVQAGIGLLNDSKQPKATRPVAVNEDKESQTAAPETGDVPTDNGNGTGSRTRVITQPVRSGQQIFAPGDLVVLASVNPGAEVLARGNIHVYGALRGRALAGIDGDEGARIFSMQCDPELIAVAGDYMVNESLDRKFVNQSVIISRDADGLVFSPLGPGPVQK